MLPETALDACPRFRKRWGPICTLWWRFGWERPQVRAVLEAYGWSDLVPLMESVNGKAVLDRAVDGAPTGTVPLSGGSGLQAAMEL
jgi:hypothetical protein